jgi:hypothetical protein
VANSLVPEMHKPDESRGRKLETSLLELSLTLKKIIIEPGTNPSHLSDSIHLIQENLAELALTNTIPFIC